MQLRTPFCSLLQIEFSLYPNTYPVLLVTELLFSATPPPRCVPSAVVACGQMPCHHRATHAVVNLPAISPRTRFKTLEILYHSVYNAHGPHRAIFTAPACSTLTASSSPSERGPHAGYKQQALNLVTPRIRHQPCILCILHHGVSHVHGAVAGNDHVAHVPRSYKRDRRLSHVDDAPLSWARARRLPHRL